MQGSKKKMPFSVNSIKVHFVMAEIDEFFAVLVLGRSTIQNVDDGFASFLKIGYKWTKSSLSIIPVVALCCIMQKKINNFLRVRITKTSPSCSDSFLSVFSITKNKTKPLEYRIFYSPQQLLYKNHVLLNINNGFKCALL